MAPKSLITGDYRLIIAYESASSADNWYRVLADLETGNLSCDCPRWTFARNGVRGCKHVERTEQLLQAVDQGCLTAPRRPSDFVTHILRLVQQSLRGPTPLSDHQRSLLGAVQSQWPGLQGEWEIEEQDALVGKDRYRFVLVRLRTASGLLATSVAAFAQSHGLSTARLIPGVAGWIGYGLAAEVAHQSGFPLVGRPPEHFKARSTRGGGISLRDILRVGDQVDLGDGLTPAERAENTLKMFLGELYQTLEQQGFLDIPSTLYADHQRVYRLRRDPARRRERRLRVFEKGRYINDYCVVRAAAVPEADHYLTLFLQLMADEAGVLEVVKRHNIFPPNSDGQERETVPVDWRPRVAS